MGWDRVGKYSEWDFSGRLECYGQGYNRAEKDYSLKLRWEFRIARDVRTDVHDVHGDVMGRPQSTLIHRLYCCGIDG